MDTPFAFATADPSPFYDSQQLGPIGVFDSGYGGLTVLKEIVKHLPDYQFIYLGDNARAPYGNRSFETVYHYTLSCVEWFFQQGCSLVILACNTASAKALRTIQQQDLPKIAPNKRVLGVIRPTTEVIGRFTHTNKVGIMGTSGTVMSNSYPIEIAKFYPEIAVFQEACPMWVPLIENNAFDNPGADYFIEQNLQHLLQQDPAIDTILLACTHYPLLMNKLMQLTSKQPHLKIISQGEIVASSLVDYLNRHPEINQLCKQESGIRFFTTDDTSDFNQKAAIFWGQPLVSEHAVL